MLTITTASSKGGVGKTLITTALAVRAAQDHGKVGLIGLDPQQTLSEWWHRRVADHPNEKINPILCEDHEILRSDLELLREAGYGYAFIDTPPALMDTIDEAITVADVVIVPVRASAFDLEAIEPVVEMCRERNKRFGFVLNGVHKESKTEPKSWATLVAGAEAALKEDGRLLGTIEERWAYVGALTTGKTGPEMGRGRGVAARREIDALWRAVNKLASGK